ncbi:MAG: protein kinase [Deltaproteobacteria bacterium]|nr:protein kinase [Deltaproteobacteria bacterium]
MTQETLAGYELLERIAVGGMGEVFRARRTGPGGFEKDVAIKRLLPDVARSPELVRMFFDEARLAARLSSPGLVQVFDFGEGGGLPYLVMEYVAGTDLAALLARGGALPSPLAVHVAGELCQTLSELHAAAGVVHRDVTPSNVLVSLEGRIKLADLGIAKACAGGKRTEPGALKGKLSYLAPEQLRGEEADARTDLYMLGLVLFEALTGEPYLRAENDAALIRVAERPVFRAPSSLRPELPFVLDAVLRRALDPEREQRFPSVEHLRRALEESGTMPDSAAARRQLGELAREPRTSASEVEPGLTSSKPGPAPFAQPRALAATPRTEILLPDLPAPARRMGRSAMMLVAGIAVVAGATGAAFFLMRRPTPAALSHAAALGEPEPTLQAEPGPVVAVATSGPGGAEVSPASLSLPPPVAKPGPTPARPTKALAARSVPAPGPQPSKVSLVPSFEQPPPSVKPPDVSGARAILGGLQRSLTSKGIRRDDAPALFAAKRALSEAVGRGEAPLEALQSLSSEVDRVVVDKAFVNAKIDRLSRKVAALPSDQQRQLRGASQAALAASLAGRFEEANRHLNAIAASVEQ